MTIRFSCIACGKKFKCDERAAGRRMTCTKCGAQLTVPQAEEPAKAAPAATSSHSRSHPVEVLPPLDFRTTQQGGDELDLTPMVDVTFQLLIFFMLTMALGLQKSIEMPTSNESTQPAESRSVEDFEEDDDFIIVRIDPDDTIWVEESEATRMEIVPKLRRLREERHKPGAPPPNSLLVMASGEAHHETVVAVLDAGTEVGMQNVRLSSLSDDDEL